VLFRTSAEPQGLVGTTGWLWQGVPDATGAPAPRPPGRLALATRRPDAPADRSSETRSQLIRSRLWENQGSQILPGLKSGSL
jgi:hypothetical protein